MKKILLGLALCTAMVSYAGVTENDRYAFNYRANQNLITLFGPVEDVKWSRAKGNLYRADFVYDDEKTTAFFDNSGDFVASTRNVSMQQLSYKMRKSLQHHFKGETITSIVQLNTPTEYAYIIEIAKGNGSELFKSNPEGTRIVKHRL